jgi:catechol 2,3-dioxygenase-like lactoylglutathione lyase family enzyme
MKAEIQQTKKSPSTPLRRLIFGAYLVSFLLITAATYAVDSSTVPVDSIAKKSDIGIGILGMVHASLGVSDLDRALHFYVDQLGFKVVIHLNKPDGTPRFLYLQISDDTFVELFPNVTRNQSQSSMWAYHFGLVVQNLQATLHALEARGYPMPADAYEIAAKLAVDGTYYYNIKDPDGNIIELSQFNPESLLVKSSKKLTKLVQ